MALVDIYTTAVFENLKPLRGQWEPSQPVRLGDYGVMVGHAFQRLGNVEAFGIDLGESIDDHVGDSKTFLSGRDSSIKFDAKGAAAANPAITVSASVEITLASANSAFFNAADCSYSMVADKTKLGHQIEAAFSRQEWRREWVVVTDLVHSGATTVAVSEQGSGSLVIQAKGDVPSIDLADANVGLSMRSLKNVGYQVVAQKGLSPLIGLSQIQSRFFRWTPEFKPFTTSLLMERERALAMLNDPGLKTEEPEDLRFAQLQ